MQDYLKAAVIVTETPESAVVLISYDHPDPRFATEFLSKVDRAADAYLRGKTLARTSDNINYISDKLSKVTLADHRVVLAETLGEQERARMMASSRSPFAADPFGNATASLRPTRPQPVIVLLIGCVGGLMIGMLAALYINYLHHRRQMHDLKSTREVE